MNILFVSLMIFIISVFIIEMFFYAYKIFRNPNRAKTQKRIKTIVPSEFGNEVPDIQKKNLLSDVPLLNRILMHVPGIVRLDRLIKQANAKYHPGFFILLSMVLALIGFESISLVTGNRAYALIIAALLGVIPFFYIRLRKKKRMQKFEKQLPDALALIARALRAGHAFSSGMKLAADEFDDPLGPEFDQTLDQINFGVGVPKALSNLANRLDCPDLKYFVVSVNLQRETGGNLAEIIDSIAYIIRERFKLQGKIRVLAAEGKLTARILIALPFFIITVLHFLSPDYMLILFTEATGKIIVGIAAFMMVLGIFIMKRMVAIKV